MAQIEMQTTATNAASKTNLPRRFVARLVVSSILSAAGLLSFALTGPIMCRIAAIDPALEAFYKRGCQVKTLLLSREEGIFF